MLKLDARSMSLKGRLGARIRKRIEAMPSMQAAKEHLERVGPVSRAAQSAAYSTLDDEAAKTKLRARLDADPETLRETTLELGNRRTDYIRDRAYRLLSAASTDTAVLPIPSERAEQYAEEEALGRMPIERAFQRLAEREPRLLDVEREARRLEARDLVKGTLPGEITRRLIFVVAASAEGDEQILHSSLATSIVHQYLGVLAGDTRLGPSTASYFEHPIRQVSTAALGIAPRKRKG